MTVPMVRDVVRDEAADYRILVDRVRAAGLMHRRRWYYSAKIVLTVAGFMLGWAAFFVVGNSWATIGVAALLAIMYTQVVFLGHDAGHQQVARSRGVNRMLGLVVGNALTGLSFGWWVPKHNAHHAYPNQVDRDPDIGAGLIAFTVVTGDPARHGVAVRLRARFQTGLFFVLLLLQGVGLHVTSVQSILRRRNRSALVEGLLLVGNAALYLTVVFWVLSPLKALVFIAVHQGLFGLYLGSVFAPNHKGMPIIASDAKVPYAERQVITARNLIGGRITTTVCGGLNYQIEHHLFPTMPRPNLVRAQHFVRAFCVEHDLPYNEARPVASYRSVLDMLRTVDVGLAPSDR
jgi:fatty acid desaturase